MSGRWSRAVAGAALVLALPALSACNGGGDPGSDGTPTPKFSEAPSESASASVTQSSSAEDSDSATAVPKNPRTLVRVFISGVGVAINTGDPRHFMRYATDGCSNCSVVAKNVDKAYSAGRSAETSGWTVVSLDEGQRISG